MRPKLIADHMLGRLARYLRFMGYDVYYPTGKESDEALMKRAEVEGRIIITRDRALSERYENARYLPHHGIKDQLVWFFREFGGPLRVDADRCSVCNGRLRPASVEEVAPLVPEGVLERLSDFYVCPICGKVYWWGSHADRMEREIAEAWKRALADVLKEAIEALGEKGEVHICLVDLNLYGVCGEGFDDPSSLCDALAEEMGKRGFPSRVDSVLVEDGSFRAVFSVISSEEDE